MRKCRAWFVMLVMVAGCAGDDTTLPLGPCGKDCGAAVCDEQSKTCVCPQGLSWCSGRCVDVMSDSSNCAACGLGCSASNTCTAGRCSAAGCAVGASECSGACTNTKIDPANCGSCGSVCDHGLCGDGRCIPCLYGQDFCSGRCLNLSSSNTDCGACFNSCRDDQVCSRGSCVSMCGEGLTNCLGECVDLKHDPMNCGSS